MVGLQQWMLRTLMLYIARTTLAQAGASEGKDDANALAAKKLASATANSDSFVLVSCKCYIHSYRLGRSRTS